MKIDTPFKVYYCPNDGDYESTSKFIDYIPYSQKEIAKNFKMFKEALATSGIRDLRYHPRYLSTRGEESGGLFGLGLSFYLHSRIVQYDINHKGIPIQIKLTSESEAGLDALAEELELPLPSSSLEITSKLKRLEKEKILGTLKFQDSNFL
jgi:hypothetical protein